MDNSTQWKLNIGVHRGTLTSRDSQIVTTKFHDYDAPLASFNDCVECSKSWQQNCARMGFYLWYANAISPDGIVYANIIQGKSYRS